MQNLSEDSRSLDRDLNPGLLKYKAGVSTTQLQISQHTILKPSPNLCSSRNVRDQVLHLYTTISEIIILFQTFFK
jgi:hypothetical protein